MKPGDRHECAKCGADTFLKKESVMDGWTKVGEVFKCASCGVVVATSDASDDASKKDAPVPGTEKKSALLDFLGEKDIAKPKQEFMSEETCFCRDCAHLVTNAFRLYCSKHEKDMNPMDDCSDFQRKSGEGRKQKAESS